jgi:hypothetical protein
MVLALMITSAGLIAAAPASAAKPYPPPTAQLEVNVVAEVAGVHTGIAHAAVIISNDTGLPVSKSMTNEYGAALFDLTPGTYLVDANAPGYYNAKAKVDVSAGGPTWAIEIVLQPETPAPTYRTLVVYVTDAPYGGTGILGAKVMVYTPDGDLRAQGTTDELGLLKASLLPGIYTLAVTAEGYVPAMMPIEVGADQILDVTVVLQARPARPPQMLTLFVVGATGRLGIPGADVTIFDREGQLRTKGLTDEIGYYKPMLLPGSYKLVVGAPDFQTGSIEVDVTDTAENNAVIVLQPTIYRPLQVLALSGNLNIGIRGAMVSVFNEDHTLLAQGTTDKWGYYRPTVPVGFYTVQVYARGYEPATAQVEVTPAELTELTVTLYPIPWSPQLI